MSSKSVMVRAAALVVLWVLGTSACYIPIDERIAEEPTGEVDRTQYGGLRIMGELTIGDLSTGKEIYELGPLRLDLLQVAMLSQCYDQLVTNGDQQNVLHWVVDETVFKRAEGSLPDDQECVRKLALSELYRCLAFKNLELQEAVSIQAFESRPFAFEATTYPNVIINFQFVDQSRLSPHSYRIPPVNADAKTILLLAAQAAFRKSGVQAALALRQSWGGGGGDSLAQTCVEHLANLANGEPYTPAPVDMLVVGLHETISQLGDVTKKVVENELNVAASRLSTSADLVEAQELLWNGPINSHASAANNLISAFVLDNMPVGQEKRRFGTVPVPLSTSAQRSAVRVLRSARLLDTFEIDPSSPGYLSDVDLVKKVSEKVYGDLFRDALSQPPIPDAATFLQRKGLSLADIALARRYLLAERDALERDNEPDPDDPERGFGFHASAFQHPPAYYKTITPPPSEVCSGAIDDFQQRFCWVYAEDGAAQTVDYLREIVDQTLRSAALATLPLSDSQTRTLAAASLAGTSLVGSKRLMLLHLTDWPLVYLAIYGEKETDHNRFRLLTSRRAYRCAVEGRIDGAPCTEDDIEADTLTPIETGIEQQSAPLMPRGGAIWFGYSRSAWDWSKPVYLVRYGGIGNSDLMARFKFDRTTGYTLIPLIDDGLFGELLGRIVVRDGHSAGEPALMCGDTGIDRSFVPSLANELIEDQSGTGQSWRHYLSLASSAAIEADRLAEEMVAAGLDITHRSEQAMRELEELCGDVVVVDPFASGLSLCQTEPEGDCDVVKQQLQDNPSLQSCMPEDFYGGGMDTVDYTVLGSRPVCIYRKENGTGAPCQCDEEDEGCPAVCPAIAEGTMCSIYNDFILANNEKYVAEYVPNTLNVFSSSGPVAATADPCGELADLDTLVAQRNSSNPPTRQQYKTALSKISWLTLPGLRDLLNSVYLDTDILEHYTLFIGGTAAITTRQTDWWKCPKTREWDPDNPGSQWYCVQPHR